MNDSIIKLKEQAMYELKHHVHYVNGMYINGKKHVVKLWKSRKPGSGKVKCKNALLRAAVTANLLEHGELKGADYQVDLWPVRIWSTSKSKSSKSKSKSMPIMPQMSFRRAIQVGGQYPADMNPEGCDGLKLTLDKDELKTAVVYSEPVVSSLKSCAAVGIFKNPEPGQMETAVSYLDSEGPYPGMGKMILMMQPMTLIQVCEAGIIKPSFRQFKIGLDMQFRSSDKDKFVQQVRSAGLKVSEKSWDDGSFEIPVMLDHLYNHAFAHNGIQDESEIQNLMELLGGVSIVSAHVIHSLLHVYDSMHIYRKDDPTWASYLDYLKERVGKLIPDETERRCFFRVLNMNSDNFLEKDGSVKKYVLPYTIKAEAMPDKNRQYTRDPSMLLEDFRAQLTTGKAPVQTGTTGKLPNVE